MRGRFRKISLNVKRVGAKKNFPIKKCFFTNNKEKKYVKKKHDRLRTEKKQHYDIASWNQKKIITYFYLFIYFEHYA